MIRNRLLLKSFAVFFLLEILLNTVTPAISWALTAGPTAPEYTSFEPVDTTDIVNLATGDLAYNIPLLEVPGPCGGYPLSLSYHAGIMPNEEASWVGLGWTLNPGALTRTVNGYADDQIGATRNRVDYNSGGERSTFSVGVGLPLAGFGLSVSNDSNLGVGIGADMYAGANVGLKGGLGINATVSGSMDGYGGGGFGLNVGATVAAKKLTYNIGIQTNFNSVSFQGGVNTGKSSVADVSIGTNGSISHVGVGGIGINQVNSRAGVITQNSFGLTIPIPLGESGLFLNIGYNYNRYYMNESANVQVVGSLYAQEAFSKDADSWAFDSYALLDPDAPGTIKTTDPEKYRGGSFPAYDDYNVNAQGLNGNIQPYIFTNGTLFRQNLKTSDGSDYLIQYKKVYPFSAPVNFRFKNEFTSAHPYSGGEITYRPESPLSIETVSSSPTGETSRSGNGYNTSTGHMAGSKHIEWFTNEQIKNGYAKSIGFVDYKPYADRELNVHNGDISAQVGGFMITNESGVTYHYALPVYGYGEFSKSFAKGKENNQYQTNTNSRPYAYTWLLTAVTGADYVDHDGDGIANNSDWGYWVNFSYGMWTDNYEWRNPGEGMHTDLDPNVMFYSYGYKELYYLNSITTRSHTALFEKEIRADSKGVVNSNSKDLGHSSDFGSALRQFFNNDTGEDAFYNDYSRSTLKLNNIFLIKNEDLMEIASPQALLSISPKYNFQLPDDPVPVSKNVHYGDNVLDKNDLESIVNEKYVRGMLKSKSIRVINLTHDYSLQDGPGGLGVPNSFDSEGSLYSPSNYNHDKLGKLTLKTLEFSGKGGAGGLIPPMKFGYNKNPQYNKDAFDVWGFYKSDYVEGDNERLKRQVSPTSSDDVDSWSLSTIKTSLGSDINITYESDRYNEVVLAKQIIFNIKDITDLQSGSTLKVFFHESDYQTDLNLQDFFTKDQDLSLFVVGYYIRSNGTLFIGSTQCTGSGFQTSAVRQAFTFQSDACKITEVRQDYIIIDSPDLYSQMKAEKSEPVWDDDETKWIYAKCGNDKDFVNYSSGTVRFTGYPDIIAGGCVSISDNLDNSFFGGGIRVKEIGLSSGGAELQQKSTHYEYGGGVTAYEPFGIIDPILDESAIWAFEWQAAYDKYSAYLVKNYSKTLMISREVPPPGVIYSTVEVTEYVQKDDQTSPTKLTGKTVYEFQAFDQRMIERTSMTNRNVAAFRCYNVYGAPVSCTTLNTNDANTQPYTCYDAEGNRTDCNNPGGSYSSTPLMINDFTSWLGALKSISLYGDDGQLIRKTENQYLHSLTDVEKFKDDLKTKFGNQGKISQAFTEDRIVKSDAGKVNNPVLSIRSEFPLVTIGQTVTDYKTGIVTTTNNLAFDFYTGIPTKVSSSDGYGNRYITESTLAYTLDSYSGETYSQISSQFSGMGLKVNNPRNRNMLAQLAASYTYKVDSEDKPIGLVSASIQTWSDQVPAIQPGQLYSAASPQAGIWRKRSSYSFIGDNNVSTTGDGLYALTNHLLPAFTNWDGLSSTDATWQKDAEILMYDVNSHALKAADVNEQHSATKMDFDQSRVLVTGANCDYFELAYSGAEEVTHLVAGKRYFGGEVSCEGTVSSDQAHTGSNSIKVNPLGKAFSYSFTRTTIATTPSPGKYLVSFWSSQPDASVNYTINGEEPPTAPIVTNIGKVGNWYQLEAIISGVNKNDEVEVWNAASSVVTYFDDFRVQPTDAAVVSYVYNQWGELSYVLDNNNLYVQYCYDVMGRLKEVYKETFSHGRVKANAYEYEYYLVQNN